jgi:hypothetical protein
MIESTPSTGACWQVEVRATSSCNGAASGGAGTRSASAGVERTNESGWAGAGHWAVRWAT